jgi:hypothetical protein
VATLLGSEEKLTTFKKLWNNHPSVSGYMDGKPCSKNGTPLFSNQCAIRMGHALQAAGFDVSRMRVRLCWHHKKQRFHVLAAEELAKAINRSVVPGIGKLKKLKPDEFTTQIKGKKGIIFFKDYWRRSGETNKGRTGDHIDLWNGNKLTNSSFFTFWSNYFHTYDNSKEIWFWPVRQ